MINNKNKIGLTIISFLSYYLTGSMIIVTGIIMNSISKYFHVSISEISNTFTALNFGMLIAIFFNYYITKFLCLKKQIILGFILIIFSILGLIFSNNIIMFCFNIFILGFVGGLTMSIGTFLITNIYEGKTRTSRLLITDSFFSLSGMIFPIIASYFIENHILWYWIYIIIGIVYSIIFLISLNVNFPQTNHILNINNSVINKKKHVNISIIILCLSALLYILGQLIFISWIPEYTIQNIGINIESAGKLISSFWMAYMIGMWFFSYVLKFFDLQKSLLCLTGISTILISLFTHNKSIYILNIIITMLGFFSSAIYTMIITLVSLQTKKTSQKLINLTLMSGTIGTLLTFILTSPIVSQVGIYGALIVSNILYGIVFFLSWTLKFVSHHKKNI